MDDTTDRVQALGERVLAAALGTIDILAIYLGDRLGWYRALAATGPATPAELAEGTGTDTRYAREWLEQQAASGLLRVDGDRFSLPPEGVEVFTDETSVNYLAPVSRMFAAAASQLPALLQAYRTGGGVGWARLGADARESQADMNRPWYEQMLPAALAGSSDLDAVLRRDGARIADIGCGGGWSSIALARAYPDARLDAVDVDAASVELARRNVAEAGLADRVTVRRGDAAHLAPSGYDAVFAFECVHDLPRPVEVLSAAGRALRPGGSVIVMDEAVGEEFTAPAGDVDRLMYGFSLLVCLPDGRAHPASAATGTVMRPAVLRDYARQAGLPTFEALPIEDFGFWRFYRLAA